MNNFNFKVTVLCASIFEVFHRIAIGENVNEPFIEYPEPSEE